MWDDLANMKEGHEEEQQVLSLLSVFLMCALGVDVDDQHPAESPGTQFSTYQPCWIFGDTIIDVTFLPVDCLSIPVSSF